MPRTSSKTRYPVDSESSQRMRPQTSDFTHGQAQQSDLAIPFSGLYIFGQIADRSRRNIPVRDNSTAEIVTYTVQDATGHHYFIDEYSPDGYNDIGSFVEIPVYVKTFKKKNGDIGYSFCVQQKRFSVPIRGEQF